MSVHSANLRARPASAAPDPLDEILKRISDRAGAAENDPEGLAPDIKWLREWGLLKDCLPGTDGGADLGLCAQTVPATFDRLRRVGRANLSVGRLVEGHMNAVKLIALYGDPPLKREVFRAVEQGALLGVWGADGMPPVRMEKSGGRIHLTGEKIFASGVGLVRLALVLARHNTAAPGEQQMLVVDVSDAGRQDPAAWKASGMRATWSGRYDFTGISIPATRILGAPGDFLREPFFEGGVWRYCAVHAGGAERLIALWRDLMSDQGRFSDPFQLARYTRAIMLSRAMNALIVNAAEAIEAGPNYGPAPATACATDALIARQFTEECCVEILQLAEKSLGTAAYMPGAVEQVRRDLSLFIRQAAPDAKLLKAGHELIKAPSSW